MYRSRLQIWLIFILIPIWILPAILWVGGKMILPELWIELTDKNTWKYLFTGDTGIPFKQVDKNS